MNPGCLFCFVVFVLVNFLIYFVNNNKKHYENAYDLCVGGILVPGPRTQLKLKLNNLTSPTECYQQNCMS